MVFHSITPQGCNNFQLFSLCKITRNYCTPVTSIIAMSFILIIFHHLMTHFKVINFMSQSSNSIDLLTICVVTEIFFALLALTQDFVWCWVSKTVAPIQNPNLKSFFFFFFFFFFLK